ncbi:MAG: hypothetical protein JO006_19965 [Paucibacter sp.]|nr:hypothetical protein [Roseateles sp.]
MDTDIIGVGAGIVGAAATLVRRCEDVLLGAVQACTSCDEAKPLTRCAMGACQCRVCGAALEVLQGWPQCAPRLVTTPRLIDTRA